MQGERTVISKWKKKALVQVVYREAVGKTKKGKVLYSSRTRHEKA